MKIVDKITMILMTILFAVVIIYMTVCAFALVSTSTIILQMIILIVIIIIPVLCYFTFTFIFTFIMFMIRYIQNKENRLKRVLRTIAIIVIALVVSFSAHYVLLKYCLFGSYEVKVEKKLEDIEDIDLKNILELSLKRYGNYEQFKIQKVIIEPGFPDDYIIDIHYINTYYIMKIETDFISDSIGYKLVDKAEDLAEKYMPLNIALFILSIILLIATYLYLQKEYRSLCNSALQKENELSPEKLEEKRKKAKRIILMVLTIIVTIAAVIILIITINKAIKENQINANRINNEIDKKEDNITEGDTLYEKVINENIKVRVVFKGAVLAQRSIIGIEKTTDGGKTWINQIKTHDGFIQIHNGAEFLFLDENIGFINDPGLAGTEGDNRGLLVTTDGGNNIVEAKIIHPDHITEKNLLVSGLPYREDNTLKVKIYTINHKKSPIDTYYEFISKDNGKTWKYNKEL